MRLRAQACAPNSCVHFIRRKRQWISFSTSSLHGQPQYMTTVNPVRLSHINWTNHVMIFCFVLYIVIHYQHESLKRTIPSRDGNFLMLCRSLVMVGTIQFKSLRLEKMNRIWKKCITRILVTHLDQDRPRPVPRYGRRRRPDDQHDVHKVPPISASE